MSHDRVPRPDQQWDEPRPAADVFDPVALREGRGLVPVNSPEEQRAREVEARQTEGEIEEKLRANAHAALEAQGALLQRALDAKDGDVPAALRAVSDVSAKNIDGLLKVTGRDGGPAEGMAQMLEAMAARGYVKLHVELGQKPPDGEPDP